MKTLFNYYNSNHHNLLSTANATTSTVLTNTTASSQLSNSKIDSININTTSNNKNNELLRNLDMEINENNNIKQTFISTKDKINKSDLLVNNSSVLMHTVETNKIHAHPVMSMPSNLVELGNKSNSSNKYLTSSKSTYSYCNGEIQCTLPNINESDKTGSLSDNVKHKSLKKNLANQILSKSDNGLVQSSDSYYSSLNLVITQDKLNNNFYNGKLNKNQLPRSCLLHVDQSKRMESLFNDSKYYSNLEVPKPIKSPWDILCQIINCKVAFKKQYNGKKYNWIQLAGHAGRFKAGDREGYILKLMDDSERSCLEMLQKDVLSPFVPTIDKILQDKHDQKYYTEMQDLLYGFHNPSIMDIKIGVRTFLEGEVNDKETKPRNDLYEKLIEIDPNEPTEREHKEKAITKKRYMTWRETSSCSSTLGFRIEAIKKNQVSEKEFYCVREKKEVLSHFKKYTDNKKSIIVIGSSLLFVHDDTKASIWMIDFGKTRPLLNGVKLTHCDNWIEGNHEDGYLIGIQNLISLFKDLAST